MTAEQPKFPTQQDLDRVEGNLSGDLHAPLNTQEGLGSLPTEVSGGHGPSIPETLNTPEPAPGLTDAQKAYEAAADFGR